MAPATAPAAEEDLSELALSKLTRILGPQRGPRVHREVLAVMGLRELRTPDDLHLFAKHVTDRGGMDGAVGGLLSVAAVIRGASR